jgi:hypothetical protein
MGDLKEAMSNCSIRRPSQLRELIHKATKAQVDAAERKARDYLDACRRAGIQPEPFAHALREALEIEIAEAEPGIEETFDELFDPYNARDYGSHYGGKRAMRNGDK